MEKSDLIIMNNKRRSVVLKTAIPLLDRAFDIVSDVYYAEQDALENIPENLQSSSRYEKIEDAISSLDEAMDNIEKAVENLQEAIS